MKKGFVNPKVDKTYSIFNGMFPFELDCCRMYKMLSSFCFNNRIPRRQSFFEM